MTLTTIQNEHLPARKQLNGFQEAQLLELLGLPDVSGLALPADPTPQQVAEFVNDLLAAMNRAQTIVSELFAPIAELVETGRAQILRELQARNAKMLPHDELEIVVKQGEVRRRDVATLRETLPALGVPADEFAKAVFIKSVDVRSVTPELLAPIVESGGKVVYEIDLRKLDVLARRYGGEIAEVIQQCTAPEPNGSPQLVITRKARTMKQVGAA